MRSTELLDLVENIRMWRQGEQFAPHKPLLMLYAMGQFSLGREANPFVDVDRDLSQLLMEFGPKRIAVHTEYPFWRLQNDGLWEVRADAPIVARPDPRKSDLIGLRAVGSFPEWIRQIFRREPAVFNKVVRALLHGNFPETLHADILDAVGLSLDPDPFVGGQRRDPAFRRKVLRAYGQRCCVCGFDVRFRGEVAGLEAAHIKWRQAGGPDVEQNGLALCALHRKLFDLGALTVTENLRLLFSKDLAGGTQAEWVLGFHGKEMLQPQEKALLPAPQFLRWHLEHIFKSPARTL